MSSSIIDSLERIENRNIPSMVMDMITKRLLRGELNPGDKLPTEIEFSQRLGVGRNSIREAMKMLSSLGVVEIRRAEGTFIAESLSLATINPLIMTIAFAKKSPRELVELRLLLDVGIAELACQKVSEKNIDELVEANEEIGRELGRKNPDEDKLRDLDLEFHFRLNRIANNSLISKIGDTIYTLFFASMKKSIHTNPRSVYEKHKEIIGALRTKNTEIVRKTVEDTLSHWRQIL